jgi:hypothetical protein
MNHNETLVRLLAAADALLMPSEGEKPGLDTVANIRAQYVARYWAAGLPWQPGRLCGGGVKDGVALLDHLEAAGLVTCASGSRKRTHARLSPLGHAAARRAICWPVDGVELFVLMSKLRALRPQTAGYDAQGRPWWDASSLVVTHRPELLYGLVEGTLAADTDAAGRLFVTITPAGARITKCPAEVDLPEVTPEAERLRDVYDAAYSEAVERLPELPLLQRHDLHLLGLRPLSERSAAR